MIFKGVFTAVKLHLISTGLGFRFQVAECATLYPVYELGSYRGNEQVERP
jgi:hypothetical protein